jgi:hypothetical protein
VLVKNIKKISIAMSKRILFAVELRITDYPFGYTLQFRVHDAKQEQTTRNHVFPVRNAAV